MTKETPTPMTVFAIRDGFYDKYRRAGDKFTIRNSADFSKRWMVEADSEAGRMFQRRHEVQTNAARDAITGERLQSGGSAEEIAILRAEIAELKKAQGGNAVDRTETENETVANPDAAGSGDANDDAPAPQQGRRRRSKA